MKAHLPITRIRFISTVLILIGLIISMTGAVRTGTLILSIGASIFILIRYYHQQEKRNIEIILPLIICFMLFVLAISLPNAR